MISVPTSLIIPPVVKGVLIECKYVLPGRAAPLTGYLF